MPAPLFYLFSAVMLFFGLMVVVRKNPVSSAMALVMSFVGLAALFVSLNAYFVGVIQILVYAGAVMVLFLFIIMLLDIRKEEGRTWSWLSVGGGALLFVLVSMQLVGVLMQFEGGKVALKDRPLQYQKAMTEMKAEGTLLLSIAKDLEKKKLPDTKLIGQALFTRYAFPLQVVAVLLLVATIGVVLLSKRELT